MHLDNPAAIPPPIAYVPPSVTGPLIDPLAKALTRTQSAKNTKLKHEKRLFAPGTISFSSWQARSNQNSNSHKPLIDPHFSVSLPPQSAITYP